MIDANQNCLRYARWALLPMLALLAGCAAVQPSGYAMMATSATQDGCSIPTCTACTLYVRRDLSATTTGTFTPYNCTYQSASMTRGNSGLLFSEPVVKPASGGAYNTTLTKAPFAARTAYMCLWNTFGNMSFCHQVPFGVH